MRSIKGSNRGKTEMEKLMSSSVQAALNPENTFVHFATIMDDLIGTEYGKRSSVNRANDKPNGVDLSGKKNKRISYPPFFQRGVLMTSYRRLDDTAINRILEFIEESRPEYNQVLKDVKQRILFESARGWMRLSMRHDDLLVYCLPVW